jgi:hypothetical protein
MNSHITEMHARENWITPARATWIMFALTLTTLNIFSQIASWRQMQDIHLTPEQMQGLQAMGLTVEFYAAWRFFWQIPLPLFWGGLGLLIFLRRSNDRAALIVSAMMLGAGLIGSVPLWTAFANAYPQWIWIVAPMAFVGNFCLNSFFAVFPTGRFVPRWTVVTAIVLSALNILNSYDFALPPSFRLDTQSGNWILPIFIFVALPLFVVGPFYRYRWRSTPTEREQIKWVVLAIGLAFTFFAIAVSTVFWAPHGNPEKDMSFVTVFVQPIGWIASLQLIPVSIGVSILRYRLFDIDLIIRRTLQYSVLSGLLALTYFGIVVVLQRLFAAVSGSFGFAQDSPVAIVLSTLAIAALFNPVRRRVQDAIDRRFYRKKYDAAKVIAEFAATCRDETDLDKLTARLIEVVQETMQPTHVSLWLRKDPKGFQNPSDLGREAAPPARGEPT